MSCRIRPLGYDKEKNKKGVTRIVEGNNRLGRKRKDPEEVVKSISINLKQKIITEIEKEGKAKHIIEKMVKEKYEKQ